MDYELALRPFGPMLAPHSAMGPILVGILMSCPTPWAFVGTTNSVAAPAAFALCREGTGTGIGGFLPDEVDATPETARAIRDLHSRSGLTWDELGRILGVSRRAVHGWASGAKLNQSHASRLTRVTAVIDSYDRGDPALSRAALHAPGPHRSSIFQHLVRTARPVSDRPEGFTPAELLAAEPSAAPPTARVVEEKKKQPD